MMKRLRRQPAGMGVIGLIITLIVVGYGAFVGIQYLPQLIEAQTVNSILDSIKQDHKADAIQSTADIERAWEKNLNINEMNDLQDALTVDGYRGKITMTVSYQRKLDLLYTKKVITYEKKVTLD